jgi:hypothetical protein
MQGSGMHIHVSEPVSHDGRKTFNVANPASMEELISCDFKGFDEVVHSDSVLTSFIEENIEVELIVAVSIVIVVAIVVAGFISELYHLFILFN